MIPTIIGLHGIYYYTFSTKRKIQIPMPISLYDYKYNRIKSFDSSMVCGQQRKFELV